MNIVDFPTWKLGASAYWYNEIDLDVLYASSHDDMKAQVDSFLDALEALYTAYKASAMPSLFYRSLLEFYSYVTMHNRLVLPVGAPVIPELIVNDDIRNLFQAWIVALPAYAGLFTIEEEITGEPPVATGDGIIVVTATYTALEGTLTNALTTDIAALTAFETSLGTGLLPTNVYMQYGHPETSFVDPTNIDWTKERILSSMYLSDVLSWFGWNIQGVNI